MLFKVYVLIMFNVYCYESHHSKFRCIQTMINKVSLLVYTIIFINDIN